MRRLFLITALVLATAACTSPTPHAQPSTPTLPPSSSAAPTTTTAPGPSTSSRGTIVKALGQQGGIGPDDQHELLTFVVDSIAPARCDNGSSFEKPTGTLFAVHMRLSTAPGIEVAQLGPMGGGVNPASWQFVGSNGVTDTQISDPSVYGCLKSAEMMTDNPLAPGSSYVGSVVLDLPEPHGALIWAPGGLTNGTGWEWDF